jgi:hypothetical protein
MFDDDDEHQQPAALPIGLGDPVSEEHALAEQYLLSVREMSRNLVMPKTTSISPPAAAAALPRSISSSSPPVWSVAAKLIAAQFVKIRADFHAKQNALRSKKAARLLEEWSADEHPSPSIQQVWIELVWVELPLLASTAASIQHLCSAHGLLSICARAIGVGPQLAFRDGTVGQRTA